MMQELTCGGIPCTIYSKEIHAIDTVMFFLHGRKCIYRKVDIAAHAQKITQYCMDLLQPKMAIVAFDARNHGKRCVEKARNESWNEGNRTHATDLYSLVHVFVSHVIDWEISMMYNS